MGLMPVVHKPRRVGRYVGIAVGATAIVALLFWVVWMWLFGAAHANRHYHVYFTVYPGESTRQVAVRLEQNHLIRTGLGFIFLAEQKHWANRLRPGTYRVLASQTPLGILSTLVEGEPIDQISVTDGITADLVIARLLAHHIGTQKQYQSLQQNSLAGMPPKAKGVSDALEGYLYPATYAIGRGSTARSAIETMWSNFVTQTASMRRQLPAGWTVRKWVTLASMVQAEAKYSTDDSRVAAVFLNRLAKHMPLQSDATVYYALGEHVNGPLTLANLAVKSPYNTYRVRGLPPGPIDSPGPAALWAVLHPAHVNYLYFVTNRSGHALFATTYAEQLRHIAAIDGQSKPSAPSKTADQ